MSFDDSFLDADGLPKRSKCRSCGAEIIWALTDKGKKIPVNAEPVKGSNLKLSTDGDRLMCIVVKDKTGNHITHFMSCTQADSWRRK